MSRREFVRTCSVLAMGAGCLSLAPLSQVSAWAAAPRRGKSLARTRPLMGTFVTITVAHESKTLAEEAVGRAFSEMERLIAIMDRHDPRSALSCLNDQGLIKKAPPELLDILGRAVRYNSLTNGAFDPTILPLFEFIRSSGGVEETERSDLDEVRALVGCDRLAIDGTQAAFTRRGMAATLDGIAKGSIVDKASEIMTGLGARTHLVDAGGDIRAASAPGSTPWTIAVQDPGKQNNYPGIIRISNGAIATSGDYESQNGHKPTNHLVDPRAGAFQKHTRSASVRAASVMQADALATALSVAGPRKGLRLISQLPSVEALIVTESAAIPTANWG